ncbi:MAG: hypothetical protein AB7F23_02960 [Phycisphaerae bacterium]|jgi:hypothetical protein
MDKRKILEEVGLVYEAIERRLGCENGFNCDMCGDCCDFGAFGHRLFVTTPELMYFRHYVPIKTSMTGGVCPYREDNRCLVHKYRFAGCRVFGCRRDEQLQSELSEFAVGRFREICDKYGIDYLYTDLQAALAMDI